MGDFAAFQDHSSLSPQATPPLTPPPANQPTKVPPLWSRPSLPCENGMRPNSVLHKTSVSSSMPRALRSLSRAAMGLSVAAHMGGSSLAMLAWLSQLLVGPPAPLQI